MPPAALTSSRHVSIPSYAVLFSATNGPLNPAITLTTISSSVTPVTVGVESCAGAAAGATTSARLETTAAPSSFERIFTVQPPVSLSTTVMGPSEPPAI